MARECRCLGEIVSDGERVKPYPLTISRAQSSRCFPEQSSRFSRDALICLSRWLSSTVGSAVEVPIPVNTCTVEVYHQFDIGTLEVL